MYGRKQGEGRRKDLRGSAGCTRTKDNWMREYGVRAGARIQNSESRIQKKNETGPSRFFF